MNANDAPSQSRAALIMTGGGARVAYQVGVMRALTELLPANRACPFPIICGTSAGAVNAAVLAVDAHDFRRGVRRLMTVWKNLHVNQVYRADPSGALRNSARWILSVITGGAFTDTPVSLLDNAPLGTLIERYLDFAAIQRNIAAQQPDLGQRLALGRDDVAIDRIGHLCRWRKAVHREMERHLRLVRAGARRSGCEGAIERHLCGGIIREASGEPRAGDQGVCEPFLHQPVAGVRPGELLASLHFAIGARQRLGEGAGAAARRRPLREGRGIAIG